MAKATLLLADNDTDFLDTRREFLQKEGFNVLPAAEPEEARNILIRGEVDLAILDIRLFNDNDPDDFSGLDIAKEVTPQVPKIILTRWATYQAVRDALRERLSGLPPAVDFVAKQEGPQALLTAINRTLKLRSHYREVSDDTSAMLVHDHRDARRQALWNSVAGLLVAIVGAGIVFRSLQKHREELSIAILRGALGVIISSVGWLFFRRSDRANARMDRYHQELLETRQLDILLAACQDLPEQRRQESTEKVIEVASRQWLGSDRRTPRRALKEGERVTKKE